MALSATHWETFEKKDVEKAFNTSALTGLSATDISERHKKYGKNILEKTGDLGLTGKVLKQFKSPLVFTLLAAGIATFFLHDVLDTVVIFIALIINVIVGTFQEERASKAFEKLNASQERYATVIRDGKKVTVLTEDLVPGDVVALLGGSYVPADVYITEAKNLSINESALTGEWVSVSKEEGVVKKNTALSDRLNMAWMGTLVSVGYGQGIVVSTGEDTEVGKIAKALGTADERVTPLQNNIRNIARFLVIVIACAIVAIFALGLYRGEPVGNMLILAIAIAVATIPAGLPAAVTVVLALGMESILKRGGLVRNLLAAETLGATTVILTDKTGTLTEAKMQLSNLYTLESLEKSAKKYTEDDLELLRIAVRASDAFIEESSEDLNKLVVKGRPIEKAIVTAGLENGITQVEMSDEYHRIDFLQFESKRRFGASLNKNSTSKMKRIYFTGAPEFLLGVASHSFKQGKQHTLTDEERNKFVTIQKEKSSEGARFIGISYKDVSWDTIPESKNPNSEENEELITDSVFVGFMAFQDPIRADAKDAIAKVKGAGAQVIMLTGDNPQTAHKIAIDVGIAQEKSTVLLGADLDGKDDEEVLNILKDTKVFARVLPDQKLRIVRILKNNNEVVAMTGDGVNDAPALRSANIGVAVGSGTEVAKEASDLILINNSFAIIVAAIEEGRRIIDNLKKIIAYLLSTSFSEIFLIGGALVMGLPIPLLPTQILWANIVEEGVMSFPFAFEKKDANSMKRDPRSHRAKNILTKDVKKLIFTVGVITGTLLFILYVILSRLDLPIEEIRTIMFFALSIDSIFFAFSLKSFDQPLWKINFLSNKFLIVGLVTSVTLLICALLLPPLQILLSLTPLSLLEVLLLFGVGIVNLLTIEVSKYFLFRKKSVA